MFYVYFTYLYVKKGGMKDILIHPFTPLHYPPWNKKQIGEIVEGTSFFSIIFFNTQFYKNQLIFWFSTKELADFRLY